MFKRGKKYKQYLRNPDLSVPSTTAWRDKKPNQYIQDSSSSVLSKFLLLHD